MTDMCYYDAISIDDGAANADRKVGTMTYRIGSFNCLNFGLGADKDIAAMAKIIKDERFDIVALQEVKGSAALNRLLRSGLLSGYDGLADDGYVNDYAFLWNTTRVCLAHTEEAKVSRTYQPRIYKQYRVDRKSGQKDLIRDPYFARFFPVGGGAPFIEIRIINTHIRFSKGQEEALGAVAMRKNEFDVLTKAIYAKEADKRYGNNRPAYTVLLGDYNLNMRGSGAGSPYLEECFELSDAGNVKRILTTQGELTTLKSPESEQPNGYSANYDHFTYDAERFGGVSVTCGRVDSVGQYCEGDFKRHREKISDHVPVLMKIDLK